MDKLWLCVCAGAVVFTGGVGFAGWHFFGSWCGVGLGAVALIAYAVAVLWLLFHNLRITG